MPEFEINNTMIKPNTGTSSSWFSAARTYYPRSRRGDISVGPTASSFADSWDCLFGSYRQCIDLTPELNNNKQNLKNISLPLVNYNYSVDDDDVHVCILAMFNMYAVVKKQTYIIRGATIQNPTWNIDFLCSVGDTYYIANKWEAKFHGRCMLNLKKTTYLKLKESFINREFAAAWQILFNIYDFQLWCNALANPCYLRNGTRNGPASRSGVSIALPPLAVPVRSRSRDSSSRLGYEYLGRGEEEGNSIITTRELGRMLSNTTTILPGDYINLIHELLISLQMFQPMTEEQEDTDSIDVLLTSSFE